MYSFREIKMCAVFFYSSLYECLSAIATGVVMLCSLLTFYSSMFFESTGSKWVGSVWVTLFLCAISRLFLL